MNFLHSTIMGAYGGLWKAATPFLRRHKRLRDGFASRLVPDDWLVRIPEDLQQIPSAQPQTTQGQAASALPVQDRPAPTLPVQMLESGTFPEHDSPVPQKAMRFWIQAASGGEAWLVHSLLPAIIDAYRKADEQPAVASPQSVLPLEFFCTSCTRQGMETLAKLEKSFPLPQNCTLVTRYFPLDAPAIMDKAANLLRPDAIVLLETELWPGLLAAARKRAIPVVVLNGRMTEKSFAAYKKTPKFWRALAPDGVLAISEADAKRFSDLFGIQAGIMPNIKFDRTKELLADSDPALLAKRRAVLPDDVLLVAFASVREEEEGILLQCLQKLHGMREQGVQVAFALAPRHMHRVPVWQEQLQAHGITWKARSAQSTQPPEAMAAIDEDSASISTTHGGATETAALLTENFAHEGKDTTGMAEDTPGAMTDAAFLCGKSLGENPLPVLLWDTFGEMQTLFAFSDVVFVGGSVAPLGGQNFLEPLAQGVRPLVGPYTSNFLWVGEDIFAEGLVTRVQGDDLAAELEKAVRLAVSDHLTALSHIEEGVASAKMPGNEQVKEQVRSRFAGWLSSRLGGSAQAARFLATLVGRIF